MNFCAELQKLFEVHHEDASKPDIRPADWRAIVFGIFLYSTDRTFAIISIVNLPTGR